MFGQGQCCPLDASLALSRCCCTFFNVEPIFNDDSSMKGYTQEVESADKCFRFKLTFPASLLFYTFAVVGRNDLNQIRFFSSAVDVWIPLSCLGFELVIPNVHCRISFRCGLHLHSIFAILLPAWDSIVWSLRLCSSAGASTSLYVI